MSVFDGLNDAELDALVKYKQDGTLDDATLEGLSDEAIDALVEIKKSAVPEDTRVMEGGIDHSLPEGFGQGEELPQPSIGEKVEANDKAFGKAVSETLHNVTAPLIKGTETVLNKIPGVEVDFSKSYDPKKVKEEEKKTDLAYEVYDLAGKLADTRINLTGEDKEGLASYENGLHNIIVNKLGHKSIGQDERTGEYIVTTKEGEEIPLNKSTAKQILSESLGDKYELAGSFAGAKLGYDASKPLKNPYVKGVGIATGAAIGAAGGSLLDTFVNAIETGQKLTAEQYANEANKAAALDIVGGAAGAVVVKGVVSGIKGAYKATDAMLGVVDRAKKFDISDYAQKKIIDDMAKLPEVEQGKYLDALEFAKEHNIRLTSTSVLDHPQIDQLVQVLARNPFIRQGVKNLEAKSRDKLIAQVFDVLEEAGPKATPEELDPLLKQELEGALSKRNAQVRGLYDDFEQRVSGDVVTTAKGLMEDIQVVGSKYGFKQEDGKIFDEEIAAAQAYVDKLILPRADKKMLDAKMLDKVSSHLGKKAEGYKVSNSKLHGYYSEAKQLIDKEIERVSAYEGDEVAQALSKARAAYKEKVGIFGRRSEYSDIRKAMESDRPNEAISSLLQGEKAMDNANMLKQELGSTTGGKALLGALGRKHVDDVLEKVDMKSPLAISKALNSDKMKVAKRLLGEERSKSIDEIGKLLEMMGRTERLLSGAGSEIATASAAPLTTRLYNGVQKMLVRLQQQRIFGKVFDNTVAQEMMLKTLRAASSAKTPRDVKLAESYLHRTARIMHKTTDVDFSDIYDKKQAQKIALQEKKAAQVEAEKFEQEVETFAKPDNVEMQAVNKLANNDDVVVLSQSIRRIQEDKATTEDIARYLRAKKSIEPEAMAKGLEKERVIRLPAKYREENLEEELANMTRLRDYLLSNPELKYGNEFHPNSVKALMDDLRTQGFPRSTKHDALYDEMKSMYKELKPRIDEAYGDPAIKELSDDVLDANGNPLFMKGIDHLLAGGIAGVEVDEHGNITLDPEKFIMGLGGYAAAKAMLKSPRVQKEIKDLVLFGLEKVEKNVEGGVFDARSFMSPFDDSGMGKLTGIPQEIESFGRNFSKYKTKPKEAIEHLMKVKNGQVRGALYHPEIGEIDIVWGKVIDGDAKTGYGLAHIIDKHGEDVAKSLDDIVMGGKVSKQKGNTVELVNKDEMAVIKLDWEGKHKQWVITTFDMPPRQTITDDVALAGESGNLSPKAESSIAQSVEDVKKAADKLKRDENFKKWFEGSKVVDDKGEPLVVYHGTNQDVKYFDSAMRGKATQSESAEKAFYFTENPDAADEFARNSGKMLRHNYKEVEKRVNEINKEIKVAERKGDWGKVDELNEEWEKLEFSDEAMSETRGINIIPVYLNAKKPLVVDFSEKTAHNIGEINKYVQKGIDGGYDSVVLKHINDSNEGIVGNQYIVFDPTQIKSIHNQGTFSKTNPNILKSSGAAGAVAVGAASVHGTDQKEAK